MNTFRRALAVLLGGFALLALGASAALAAPITANLRVEGAEGKALDPGTDYATDTVEVPTRTSKCGGDRPGDSRKIEGPTALGLIEDARKRNGRLDPFLVSDQFDFGLLVCQIGGSGAFNASQAWLYKVNHKEAQVGGEQYELSRRDQVLWFFAEFPAGANTGKELGLRVPTRAKVGSPVTLTAVQYDGQGAVEPAPGVTISGDSKALTGPDGTAEVTFGSEGTKRLRASRATDIPAAPVSVRVAGNPDSSRAPSSSRSAESFPDPTGSGSGDGSRPDGGSGPGGGSGSGSGSGSGEGSRFSEASDDQRGIAAGGEGSDSPTFSPYRGGADGDSKPLRSPDSAEVPNGHSLGELLSGTAGEIATKPSSSRPPSSGGGVPLVVPFIALGAVMLTAVSGFLARRIVRARSSRLNAIADRGKLSSTGSPS
jgi:hypothetical protein